MNPDAIKELKRILSLEPRELKEHEIGFLKARWPYVGKVSREKFKALLEGKVKQVPVDNQAVDPNKPKDETVEAVEKSNPFETVDEDEE